MAHARQSIRDNVVTTVTGLSTTGTNVFRSRVYPLGEYKLPALCVYTAAEEVEYNRLSQPRDVDRTVEAPCQGHAGRRCRGLRWGPHDQRLAAKLADPSAPPIARPR